MRCKNPECLAVIRYPSEKNRVKQLCGVCAGAVKKIRRPEVSERAARLGLAKHRNPDNDFQLDNDRLREFNEVRGTGATQA